MTNFSIFLKIPSSSLKMLVFKKKFIYLYHDILVWVDCIFVISVDVKRFTFHPNLKYKPTSLPEIFLLSSFHFHTAFLPVRCRKSHCHIKRENIHQRRDPRQEGEDMGQLRVNRSQSLQTWTAQVFWLGGPSPSYKFGELNTVSGLI